jgi:D-alanyl-D-alanine-carboxypeptidase/D-alanyl-D-alanine-endopeptidase
MRNALLLLLCTATLAAQTPHTPDPALPPADITTIQAILNKDLAPALATGDLAPATHGGVSIGILVHGQRLFLTYGTAKPESIFEIGSISKTFTATTLAQMVEQHTVRLDEPVRDLLNPACNIPKPAGREITLLDLSDQHSGLPRMPPLPAHPADPEQPMASFGFPQLCAYLSQHNVALKDNTPFLYSNLGVGTLGAALAHRAGTPYDTLLRREVTGPLGLHNTSVALTPAMQQNLIQGHHPNHQPAPSWQRNVLEGAGGIRSDASDMLTYLDAQLHPHQLPASVAKTTEGKTLAAAIDATHIPHADTAGGRKIALNWFYNPSNGAYWHDGATTGYSAYATFNIQNDIAVIVLFNASPGTTHFADKLAPHIVQRLTGKPAVSLAP